MDFIVKDLDSNYRLDAFRNCILRSSAVAILF